MNMTMVNGNIWRGREPGFFEYRELASAGITDVLDLETGARLVDDGDLFTAQQFADGENIRVWNLPLGTVLPPTVPELASAAAFLERFRATPHRGVYVHCRQGVDRTGMVCAFYRMRYQGWPKEQAVDEMRRMGMHWWYFYWAWSLHDWRTR